MTTSGVPSKRYRLHLAKLQQPKVTPKTPGRLLWERNMAIHEARKEALRGQG